MFKKLKIKSIIIIFLVLLVIVVLVMIIDSIKGDRSYELKMDFDSAKVTAINIITKSNLKEELRLIKENNEWKVEQNGKSYNADEARIGNLISQVRSLKAEQVAAVSKDKWKEYEVVDSSATRVIVKKGKKVLKDLYVGKFSYQNPTNPYERQGKMTTYVRLADEDNVYAVNGFLRMTFNSDMNQYRDNKLIKGNSEAWTKLSFTYPADSSFVLLKENEKWMIDGVLADSAKVASYLSALSFLTSYNFVDDSQSTLFKNVSHSLKIEENGLAAGIEITAMPADTVNKYIVASTLNQGAYFSGAKSDLFGRVFKGKNNFLVKK